MNNLVGMLPRFRLSTVVILFPIAAMIFSLNLRSISFFSSNEGYVFKGGTVGFPFPYDAVYSSHVVDLDIRDLRYDPVSIALNLLLALPPVVYWICRWPDSVANPLWRKRKWGINRTFSVVATILIFIQWNIHPRSIVHSRQSDFEVPTDQIDENIRCYRGSVVFEQGWPFTTYRYFFAQLDVDSFQIYVDNKLIESGSRDKAISESHEKLFDDRFDTGQRRQELHRCGRKLLNANVIHSRTGYCVLASLVVGWYVAKALQFAGQFLNYCTLSLKRFLQE